ncbi:hypothetical protein O3P69_017461 [Scylla paramamosain]|uniref:Uncharacterized protein n=1 Tax=Scylla paramamosain TaxID=85552 RepID=A0AAW0TVW7_SCYPA
MIISYLYSLRSLNYPSDFIFIHGRFGTEQVKTVYGRNVKLSTHRCDNVLVTHIPSTPRSHAYSTYITTHNPPSSNTEAQYQYPHGIPLTHLHLHPQPYTASHPHLS